MRDAGYDVTLVWCHPATVVPEIIAIEGVEIIAVAYDDYLAKHRIYLQYRRSAREAKYPTLSYRSAKDQRAAGQRLSAREARHHVVAKERHGLGIARLIHRARSGALTRREHRLARHNQAAGWRVTLGHVADIEVALRPALNRIKADIVHVHDIYPLGAGVEYKLRMAAEGHRVVLIYDAHEYVPGQARVDETTTAAYAAMERELAPYVDGFIAVSEPSAKAIHKELNLAERPTVVVNCQPENAPEPAANWGTLREMTGLDESVPLVAYVGGVGTQRCLEEAIRAMKYLPEAHLAMVCAPSKTTPYAAKLVQLAQDLGLGDRVHFFDAVPPDQVCHVMEGCSVGLNPLQPHLLNHVLTLPNKVFEYARAGVPVAASQTGELARIVTEYGLGETFDPEPKSIAEAVTKILANRSAYVAATRAPEFVREYSWERQMTKQLALYQRLQLSGDNQAA